MILTVFHATTYRYDQPVRGVVQSHRLTPARCDGQRVIEWQVTVSDGIAGGAFRDGAGDWVQSHSARGPLSEITVTVRGRVETRDLAGVLRGHRERIPPEAYLRETAPTRADMALTDLGRDAVAGAADALDRAHRLAAAVHAAIAYRPGTTHAHTTAAEALGLGEGVCQDHAHALIAAARSQGIPARYVSGYLSAGEPQAAGQRQTQTQTDDGGQNQAQGAGPDHEAAHAWAELWVEGLGWVGFDAANACCPDARFIRLGSGLDSRAAAPIRGIARGHGTESLDVEVAVEAAQQ
jgi:transglutaminase-like putative cysteine protease